MERIDCETLTGGAPCDDDDDDDPLEINLDLPESLDDVAVFSNEVVAIEYVGLDGDVYRHRFAGAERPVAVLLNPNTVLVVGGYEITDRGFEDL
jgi:hypothetical protein